MDTTYDRTPRGRVFLFGYHVCKYCCTSLQSAAVGVRVRLWVGLCIRPYLLGPTRRRARSDRKRSSNVGSSTAKYDHETRRL